MLLCKPAKTPVSGFHTEHLIVKPSVSHSSAGPRYNLTSNSAVLTDIVSLLSFKCLNHHTYKASFCHQDIFLDHHPEISNLAIQMGPFFISQAVSELVSKLQLDYLRYFLKPLLVPPVSVQVL